MMGKGIGKISPYGYFCMQSEKLVSICWGIDYFFLDEIKKTFIRPLQIKKNHKLEMEKRRKFRFHEGAD